MEGLLLSGKMFLFATVLLSVPPPGSRVLGFNFQLASFKKSILGSISQTFAAQFDFIGENRTPLPVLHAFLFRRMIGCRKPRPLAAFSLG